MKIGVLTICLGKYNIFFNDLYNSLEENFLKQHEKTYYVFSDGNILLERNVKKIDYQKMGWPYDTMMRFHMFMSIKEKLSENDYLFFFNANMQAIKEMGEEIIPKEENSFLMGVNHPGFYHVDSSGFPYERNSNSICYIPEGEGKIYYQGCFNGGRSKEFMSMSKVLSKNLDTDLKNGIVPIFHDESLLNWYYKEINPLVVHPGYAYPESVEIPFDKIMIQRDKSKFGGHDSLRL